jgi:hypothetical protein
MLGAEQGLEIVYALVTVQKKKLLRKCGSQTNQNEDAVIGIPAFKLCTRMYLVTLFRNASVVVTIICFAIKTNCTLPRLLSPL